MAAVRKPCGQANCAMQTGIKCIEPGFLWETNSSSFSRETLVFFMFIPAFKRVPILSQMNPLVSSIVFLWNPLTFSSTYFKLSRIEMFSMIIWYVFLIYIYAPSLYFSTAPCRHFSYYGNGFWKALFFDRRICLYLWVKMNNPCVGPEGSRKSRLPDFKTVGTWSW